MANPRGMPILPSALIRQAAPPEPAEAANDAETPEQIDGQGRGVQDARPVAKPRRRKVASSADKTNKRGLYLTDAVWERLQLEAIRKKTNVSAIAGEVLERNLPRLRIERDA